MNKGEIIPESAVRFVRDFDAPKAKVWAFLTDSSLLPEWYGEGQIEPREGGKVSLMGGHIRGVVTGWRPEEFLAYTWNVFQPGDVLASSSEAVGKTKVSKWPVSYLEFTLDGSRLTLVHRPIPQAMQNQTMMGWHTMLDLLAAGLQGQFPRRHDVFPKNATLYGVDLNNLKG
ncbi:MAG TPA: SRPBCC domain-containing protein [Rhizomicrobium sp.]